jgi:uncharacterized protein
MDKLEGQMDEPPRFVLDVMLGSLARWLRRLGYDTDYVNDRDDPELARVARAEQRILLTRDRELAGRRGVRSLLIESTDLDNQLVQVVSAYPLPDGERQQRCSLCNAVLVTPTHQEVQPEVPPYVYRHYRQFRRCPSCGRIYWQGTHWQNMQDRLHQMLGEHVP